MKINSKRLLSILVIIAILFSLVGCGDSSDTNKDSNSSSNPTTNEIASNSESKEETKKEEQPKEVSVEEEVLLDDKGVVITLKKLEQNGFFGPKLKILIENNTDKNLTVQTRNSSVNGYMVETSISADVPAGKKANDGIEFYDSDLKMLGIGTLAELEFEFHIFDTDSWNDYLDSDVITVHTSTYPYNFVYDDSGIVMFDNGDFKIVGQYLSEDSSWLGPELIVYIENNTSKYITVQTRNSSINGFAVDTFFSSDVAPNKKCVSGVTFSSSELEENEIETIEEIELSFHIFDSNSWNTIKDTETVVIAFD